MQMDFKHAVVLGAGIAVGFTVVSIVLELLAGAVRPNA